MERIVRGFIRVNITLALSLLVMIGVHIWFGFRWTDIAFFIGVAWLAYGTLEVVSGKTALPLTNYTMRGNGSRTFEDWMGVNTDLDEYTNKKSSILDNDTVFGFIFKRKGGELMVVGSILMAIGILAYLPYFLA